VTGDVSGFDEFDVSYRRQITPDLLWPLGQFAFDGVSATATMFDFTDAARSRGCV
jgi:hypothetical protein